MQDSLRYLNNGTREDMPRVAAFTTASNESYVGFKVGLLADKMKTYYGTLD